MAPSSVSPGGRVSALGVGEVPQPGAEAAQPEPRGPVVEQRGGQQRDEHQQGHHHRRRHHGPGHRPARALGPGQVGLLHGRGGGGQQQVVEVAL